MAENHRNEENHKNPEDTGYEFMKETVRPKKKTKCRKTIFTIVLATVFGVVSCLVFCAFYPFFADIFHIESQKVTLINGTNTSKKEESTQPDTSTSTTSDDSVINQEEAATKLYQTVANRVNNSIVKVTTTTSVMDEFQYEYENSNVTSGIIVAQNDEYIYVLASLEVLDLSKEQAIEVTFQQQYVVSGKVYSKNNDIEIVIIQVNLSDIPYDARTTLEAVTFGEAQDVRNGDTVLALGNPDGYMYSMDVGVVTNCETCVYITDYKVDLLRTNMHGNEKGHGILVNLDGEVVGFITHKIGYDGIESDYCVAILQIKTVVEQLINLDEFVYFGIVANDITSEIAYKLDIAEGIYVVHVDPDSPAYKAGIQVADVIKKIDDVTILSVNVFGRQLISYRKNESHEVTLVRTVGDERVIKKVNITLMSRNK